MLSDKQILQNLNEILMMSLWMILLSLMNLWNEILQVIIFIQFVAHNILKYNIILSLVPNINGYIFFYYNRFSVC